MLVELSDRLAAIGYELPQTAIMEIELHRRRVTVDDWLAIAAALGVAPVHLVVPFEDEESISEEAGDAGFFNPTTELAIGDRLSLIPIEARPWISGRDIYSEADLDLWERYYIDETPPARRHWLRRAIEMVPEGKKPPQPAEEIARRMGGRNGRHWPVAIWLMLRRRREQP